MGINLSLAKFKSLAGWLSRLAIQITNIQYVVFLGKNQGTIQWRIQDFPLGGRRPIGGGSNLRRVHFLAKTYAKTKEIDPVGGERMPAAPPLDPPMQLYTLM